MKFISKNANLMVVLRPGIPAQPITGTPAVPTLSVRFQDGMVDIQNEEITELMLRHPAFNSDFVAADDYGRDPYASIRAPHEPTHVTTELKYGTPVGKQVSKNQQQLPPELAKFIEEQAKEVAKQMLPGMVKATLEAMAETRREEVVEEAPKPAAKKTAKKEA